MSSHTVLIIGSGFGGQAAAIALRRAGITDFRILERRSFAGGTWCQNSYPGAAVDVQSPLYSLSTHLHPWSQMFAEQAELESYTKHVLDVEGLHEHIELDAEVTAVAWDDDTHQWTVQTSSKGTFRGRFVINASGPLSNPLIPDFEGRETFDGVQFHTNGWRHDVDLTGKRVAVIGSGASAAQVIPAIADRVGHLHVFQRTPHWVLPRPDRVFTPWQRALLRRPWAHRLLRALIYLKLEARVIAFKYSDTVMNLVGRRVALNHLASQVAHPELREKLTPSYTIGCKRILMSNTLYPTLQRDDVTLHDRTDGVARIDATGIHTAGGTHLPLDVIVYATGYHATDGVLTYPVTGRDGASLAERWEAFPRAYLGTTVPSFPNLFLVTGPNTGIGHTSAVFVIESQMRYIVRAIREVLDRGARAIEPGVAAEEAYTTWVHDEMEGTVWKTGGCTSWYQSRDGHVIAMFPGFSMTFWRWCGRFRDQDHAFD